MKTLTTLALIVLLPASFLARAEDDKAAQRKARREAAQAAAAAEKKPSGVALPATSGLRLPSLFGDHMILQQKMKNTIWGWAESKEQVSVTASWGASASAQADAEGAWKVLLDTPAFGTGHSLKITGSKTIEIKDVAITSIKGEVVPSPISHRSNLISTTKQVPKVQPEPGIPS